MRPLRILLDFLTYDAAPPTNNPEDETRSKRRVEESNVTSQSRVQGQIPASGSPTPQTIALAAATCNYLAIYADQSVTINLNGDSTGIVLTPQLAGRMCPLFYMRGTVTSLTITNPSATVAANIDVRSVAV